MKPLVIFHSPCMDGAGAALAAWLRFGEEAEYRPASYGDPAPTDDEVRGRDVYVLDFSYPRAEMIRLRAACGFDSVYRGLMCFDHHKTAQADLEDIPGAVFNMDMSGAVLAWHHLYRNHCYLNHPTTHNPNAEFMPLPELLAYIQDRDLWRWELPHSREVSAALTARGCAEDWRRLIPIYEGWPPSRFDKIGDLVAEGTAILRAQEQQIARVVATAEEVEIGHWVSASHLPHRKSWRSFRALVVSCPLLQSEIGEALALESARRGRDAVGVVYYRDGKVGKWRVSLRSRDVEETDEQLKARVEATLRERGLHSREEIVRVRTNAPDVSAIAKNFGGGGHAKAAGFECKELPWL